jgi:hypothetical protein
VTVPEKENTTVINLKGGAPVPTLQKIDTAPGKRGATVPVMQPVTPHTQTDQQQNSSPGIDADANTEKKWDKACDLWLRQCILLRLNKAVDI